MIGKPMITTTFAAFAATSIILTGTFNGPDYTMTIDPVGRAHVEFADGNSANIQFNTVFESSENVIARGVTLNSTAPSRTMPGDTVNLNTGLQVIVVLRPDMTIRASAPACWQGFNREPSQQTHSC